jgi:hypothetical protein
MSTSLTSGLKSYYKLDDTSGDSVSSVTLTNTSVTYAAGKINNGAVFNGSGYLNSTTPWFIPGANPFSMAFWIKATNTGVYQWLGGMTDNANRNFAGIGLDVNGHFIAELGWVSAGNQGNAATSAGRNYCDGNWHHVAATFCNENSKSTIRLYVDGYIIATNVHTTLSYTISTLGYGSQIGVLKNYSTGAPDNKTTGTIDEFGVWNRQLLPSEVVQLFNAKTGISFPFSGTTSVISGLNENLQVAWNLNTASVIDSSGNGFNGASASGFALNSAGKINSGFLNASVNGYIQGQNVDMSGDWSVACWFKLTSITGFPVLFGKDSTTAGNRTFILQYNGSGFYYYIFPDAASTGLQIVVSQTISTNVWHSVVMSFSKTSGTSIYFNGALIHNLQSNNLCYSNTTATLDFGGRFLTGTNLGVVGYLDMCCMWNRALSTSEASTYNNNGFGTEYPFSDVVAKYDVLSNLTDTSGSNKNLTTVGTLTTTTDQYNRASRAVQFSRNIVPTAYLKINNNLGIQGTPCSFSLWYKANSTPTGFEYLFGQGDASTNVQYFIYYEFNAGTPRLGFTRQKQNTANDTVSFSYYI